MLSTTTSGGLLRFFAAAAAAAIQAEDEAREDRCSQTESENVQVRTEIEGSRKGAEDRAKAEADEMVTEMMRADREETQD